jgi:tRNA pseudouridine55 synthase
MDLVINLNKPEGITSQEATSNVKNLLKAKKAGHTGTLDPAATGILLVCINRATRLASYFSSLDKEYMSVMKLGEATDTQDAQGNIIQKSDRIEVTETEIKNAVKSFEGKILQKPPMFSALKYKGKPLYKYAKKGIDIPRKPRNVYIHHIELLNIDFPFVSIITVCSKGTYIRTLCDDIGKNLGIGAHLVELERTAVGPFRLRDAVSLEDLDHGSAGSRGVFSMDGALSWMPELTINESLVKSVRNGAPLKIKDCPGFPDSRMIDDGIKIKSPDGEFLAVGSFLKGGNTLKMEVVFGT